VVEGRARAQEGGAVLELCADARVCVDADDDASLYASMEVAPH
jgi:hypothetical protein